MQVKCYIRGCSPGGLITGPLFLSPYFFIFLFSYFLISFSSNMEPENHTRGHFKPKKSSKPGLGLWSRQGMKGPVGSREHLVIGSAGWVVWPAWQGYLRRESSSEVMEWSVCYSKCGPHSSNSSSTREPASNIASRPHSTLVLCPQ